MTGHNQSRNKVDTTAAATPSGEDGERAVLARTLESDRLYVLDRGYVKYSLFNEIVGKQSSYACRVRDTFSHEVDKELPLTDADKQAGVLSDQIVRVSDNNKSIRPDHQLRLVCVKCSPHTRRGRRDGRSFSGTAPNSDGILRIVTNLIDVPAEIIALIYSQRWIIEIFFRFFKQFFGCSHLISHNPNGIAIQCYCAIIAYMLINLWTGRKPTKRTFEMLCYYFSGLASEQELMEHLAKLKRKEDERAAKIQ
ncbi:MAG: IS4 family transposase [Pirellulaceae bacterium]